MKQNYNNLTFNIIQNIQSYIELIFNTIFQAEITKFVKKIYNPYYIVVQIVNIFNIVKVGEKLLLCCFFFVSLQIV